MTTRTKEEQQQLDEKIARIQKKNEEILRRQKEIEEDKRLAEQQNAIVKLRPSTTNISRERTPALKPSNRELREDFTDEAPPEPIQRSTRGSFRERGTERYRGQGDWKSSGPPPDPKSFLHDEERDAPPPRDRDGKGDLRRKLDRGRRGDERDDFHGGREFQRGGRRGGSDHYRTDRGRHGGRGGSSRNEQEAWRAERMLIDEARIQRQKAADGKWRREWDNEKIMQEPPEDLRHETRRLNPATQDHWRHCPQHHHHHCHHDHHIHIPPDSPPRRSHRGTSRGGRGRGRLNPAELEVPLEKFPVEVLQRHLSSPVGGNFSSADETLGHQKVVDSSPPDLHRDEFKLDGMRSIECVGNTVKISIPNPNAAKLTPKPQRQAGEPRGRFKSHTSYSSQSDDDLPRDRVHRGSRRQRTQKYQKNQLKNSRIDPETPTVSDNSSVKTIPPSPTLPAQNKPPLPPFRTEQSQKPSSSATEELKDGDGSWEDVTTSGTESMGEELSSAKSSPLKNASPNLVSTGIKSQHAFEELLITGVTPAEFIQIDHSQIEPSDNILNEYLNLLGSDSDQETVHNTSGTNFNEQDILQDKIQNEKAAELAQHCLDMWEKIQGISEHVQESAIEKVEKQEEETEESLEQLIDLDSHKTVNVSESEKVIGVINEENLIKLQTEENNSLHDIKNNKLKDLDEAKEITSDGDLSKDQEHKIPISAVTKEIDNITVELSNAGSGDKSTEEIVFDNAGSEEKTEIKDEISTTTDIIVNENMAKATSE